MDKTSNEEKKESLFSRFINGLKKTKNSLITKLGSIFHGGDIDKMFYDHLEFVLVSSDIGIKTAEEIIKRLKDTLRDKHIIKRDKAKLELKNILKDILMTASTKEFTYPLIITVVGVNGVGKTTTIGKLANYFKLVGKSVVMVAGDTFRASASEQLTKWAQSTDTKIIKYKEGADASAVVYDGISSAKSKKVDVLIVDTAGRLHTKLSLMEELKKMINIEKREWPEAQKLNFIVLDATIGQNALMQIKAFNEAIGIDGIILAKLDGSSRGGVVFPIVQQNHIPIYFVGTGEHKEDLEKFDPDIFVDGIL